jgi:hypothetical protein
MHRFVPRAHSRFGAHVRQHAPHVVKGPKRSGTQPLCKCVASDAGQNVGEEKCQLCAAVSITACRCEQRGASSGQMHTATCVCVCTLANHQHNERVMKKVNIKKNSAHHTCRGCRRGSLGRRRGRPGAYGTWPAQRQAHHRCSSCIAACTPTGHHAREQRPAGSGTNLARQQGVGGAGRRLLTISARGKTAPRSETKSPLEAKQRHAGRRKHTVMHAADLALPVQQ